MKNDASLDGYFAEAASWDMNRTAMNERSARIAWRVAIGAVAVSMAIAIVALMMLMPLKHVEPFVIRVDNATGIVDVVPVYAGSASMPEAVTRYFLDHYVTVCERFNFSTAESDYEECSAFQCAARNQAWYALWDRGPIPLSPLNALQGRLERSGPGQRDYLLQAWQRPGRPRAGPLHQDAARRAARRRSNSHTGSPLFNTPMRSPRKWRRCGAGIPSDLRSWSSAPKRK